MTTTISRIYAKALELPRARPPINAWEVKGESQTAGAKAPPVFFGTTNVLLLILVEIDVIAKSEHRNPSRL